MKIRKSFIILLFLSQIAFSSGNQEQTEQTSLVFQWAFVYQNEKGEISSLDTQETAHSLSMTDRLKIYVQPLLNAYIYMFLYDSDKKLYLIFPTSINLFDSGYNSGIKYYLPSDTDWFSFSDPGGTEEFFLLTSLKRLADLEKLVTAYNAESEGSKKDANQQDIMDNIKKMMKTYSKLSGVVLKPMSIAGDFRVLSDEIIATKVETKNFYATTIRIKH